MKNKIRMGWLVVGLSAFLASCGQTSSEAPTPTPQAQTVQGWMTKKVVVYTEDTGGAVEGAKVFNNRTNELIGLTDSKGILFVKVKPGMQLRVVEPLYGQYQNIINVKAPTGLTAQDGESYYNGWPVPRP